MKTEEEIKDRLKEKQKKLNFLQTNKYAKTDNSSPIVITLLKREIKTLKWIIR